MKKYLLLMPNVSLVLVLLCALLFTNNLSAKPTEYYLQTNNGPFRVYAEWNLKLETSDHIELFTRVVQCNSQGKNQVFVKFFNENGTQKSLSFKVKITNNTDGKNFSTDITINAEKAAMYIPNCDSSNQLLNSLKIDLPFDYNPFGLTIVITKN